MTGDSVFSMYYIKYDICEINIRAWAKVRFNLRNLIPGANPGRSRVGAMLTDEIRQVSI